MSPNAGGPVKSVETSIRIVETVEKLDGGTLDELATEMGLAKSTVYDHVKTLERNEFLVADGNEYHVGLRFLDHGGRARNRRAVYEIGKQEVTNLAEQTGELANLVVEEHGYAVYMHLARGDNAVNLDTYIGKREYMHNTAVGKAILAFLPEERVDEILDRRGLPQQTERTIATREELAERLERVRENGYALDREERLTGLTCVAAPIKSEARGVVGSISVSGPASRLNDEQLTGDLAERVVQTANIIEINVTYS